jgi:hypothetical protein
VTQTLEVSDAGGADLGTAYASVFGSDILGIDSAQFTVQSLGPSVDAVEAALTDSGIDFSNADFTASDLATALTGFNPTGPWIPYGGDITVGNVMPAIGNSDIGIPAFMQSGISPNDVVAALNTVDFDPSDLPAAGTVYSITNIGDGWANVYEAVPNDDGTAASSITDTLVTPFGNFDIPTEFDAVAKMNPGTAFAGLSAASDNSDLSDHAFTIDGTTFDPGADGFDTARQLVGFAPLLELAGGQASSSSYNQYQNLEVYDNDSDLGQVTTGWNSQNLLGIDSTQLTVTDVTPADGVDADDLPAEGTVYSVTDPGGGFANVYVAIPNADGTAAASITDTLVTPWGNFDIPTDYDAVAPMDPGAAFAGLGDAGDLGSDNAFTIDGITFDPGSDGWAPVVPLSEIAPLLSIGGGNAAGNPLAYPQDLDVYGEDGGDSASVEATLNTSNILGFLESTQFTLDEYNVPAEDFANALTGSDIDFSSADFTAGDLANALENGSYHGVKLAGGELTGEDVTHLLRFGNPVDSADLSAAGIDPDDVAAVLNGEVADYSDGLPELGSVYSVTDFGGGFSNVYVAIPDADGDAAASIQDFLVTPFGNMDLSSMFQGFDAIAPFDPADAAAGADDTVVEGAFNLFDPSTWF